MDTDPQLFYTVLAWLLLLSLAAIFIKYYQRRAACKIKALPEAEEAEAMDETSCAYLAKRLPKKWVIVTPGSDSRRVTYLARVDSAEIDASSSYLRLQAGPVLINDLRYFPSQGDTIQVFEENPFKELVSPGYQHDTPYERRVQLINLLFELPAYASYEGSLHSFHVPQVGAEHFTVEFDAGPLVGQSRVFAIDDNSFKVTEVFAYC